MFTPTIFTSEEAYKAAFDEYSASGAWVRLTDEAVPYPFIVRVGLDVDGELICTGLLLGSVDGSTRVTAGSLRELPLQNFLQHAARSSDLFYQSLRELVGVAGDAPVPRAQGAKGHDLEHYRHVLAQYRRAQREQPEAPYQLLLSERRLHGSYSTIRRWVETALRKLDDGEITEDGQ